MVKSLNVFKIFSFFFSNIYYNNINKTDLNTSYGALFPRPDSRTRRPHALTPVPQSSCGAAYAAVAKQAITDRIILVDMFFVLCTWAYNFVVNGKRNHFAAPEKMSESAGI